MLIQRSSEVEEFKGRTLEGRAYRYNRPSRVSDDQFKSTYFEEILNRADAKTLAEHDEFPLHRLHDIKADPLGTVTFAHSDTEDSLMFTALLNRSAEADALLEDDGWRDVSVGFKPIRDGFRTTEYHGRIVQRREISIVELSLAPNGTGQAKGAEVMAIRAAADAGAPRLSYYERRAKLL